MRDQTEHAMRPVRLEGKYWGKELAGHVFDTPVNNCIAENVVANAGLELTVGGKASLHMEVMYFFANSYWWDQEPRPAAVKKDIQKLLKVVNTYFQLLHELDLKTANYLFDERELERDAFESATEMRNRLNLLLEEIPNDTGGRPEGRAEKGFYIGLAHVYEECTGREATLTEDPNSREYSGPFFEFVLRCVTALGIQIQSNIALGKRLKRILNKRKLSSAAGAIDQGEETPAE